MEKILALSVHDVVDLVLRRGNLDSRVFNQSSMAEGTRLHGAFQKEQGESYISEYPLAATVPVDGYIFALNGRADGILRGENSWTVDEIKTTVENLDIFHSENSDWHRGQAIFYAYMLALEKTLSKVFVRLTYIHQLKTEENKVFETSYTFAELETYVLSVLREYLSYFKKIESRRERRNESIRNMEFPYTDKRPGQEKLIEFAAASAESGSIGFVEAPTGIGKTSSVLFPFIKALEKDQKEKIFYLTSKNSIKEAVYKLSFRMIEKGLKISALFLTSKETLCLNDKKRHCNPDECPFARQYYDKVNKVIFNELESRQLFTEGDIVSIAKEYQICPFEFQLDLSLYIDLVVGDYNYVYDPTVRLLRFFEEQIKKPYLLLVDEAHNLPGRTRDMYSSELTVFDFITLKQNLPKINSRKFKHLVDILIEFFDSHTASDSVERVTEVPYELSDSLTEYLERAKTIMHEHPGEINDVFLETYFKVNSFMNLPPDDMENFAYYFVTRGGKTVGFRLVCLDSRGYIRKATALFSASLFFSATLSPHAYYLDLLGAEEESPTLFLPSPFPIENRLILIDSHISTMYKDRDYSLHEIASLIAQVVRQKTGNYFVFFPSYEYMEKCYSLFENTTSVDILTQGRNMDNYERSEFLSRFRSNPQRTTVGFIIMGGIFSEGIDLFSDRLIGAIIIGVGLPKISFENDLIKEHEGRDNLETGFNYAYVYPGFNKVLQAAGRVIRSETDRGLLVLVDSRFKTARYAELYKDIWPDALPVSSSYEAGIKVSEFWEETK